MSDTPMDKKEIHQLLDSLRWKEDQKIVNHEGEQVWLKPCYDSTRVRIGITDCCSTLEPCEWHVQIEGGAQLISRKPS